MKEDDIIWIVFLVVAIIVTLILILRFFRKRPTNATCTNNSQCNNGLVCDNTLRLCRVPVGSTCRSNSDCVSSAVCTQGACVTKQTITQMMPVTTVPSTTPATVPIVGETFRDVSYSDCTSRNSYSDTTTSETIESEDDEVFSSYSTRSRSMKADQREMKDIIIHNNTIIQLFENGVLSTERNPFSGRRQNITKIESFCDSVYGLANGVIYRTASVSNVSWEEASDSKAKVIHISTTGDGKYLWFQTKTIGYLLDENHDVYYKIKTTLIRNYGASKEDYIECDSSSETCKRRGVEYELCYAVIYDGNVYGLDRERWRTHHNIRVLSEDRNYTFSRY